MCIKFAYSFVHKLFSHVILPIRCFSANLWVWLALFADLYANGSLIDSKQIIMREFYLHYKVGGS